MSNATGVPVVATPGAQELFIQFRGESKPLYWGTAVTAPEFEEIPRFIEVNNDLAGRSEPFQLIFDGFSAMVSVTVNRLDLGVMQMLRDHANHVGTGNSLGLDGLDDRGSLVLGRNDFSVIVRNSFANRVVGNLNVVGLPKGRNYMYCTLMGYKESAAGTRAMEAACVFRAWNAWQGPGLGFRCYSERDEDLKLSDLILR